MKFSCFAKSADTKAWLQPVSGRHITRLAWMGCSAGASHNDTFGVGRLAWLFMVCADSPLLYMSAGALHNDMPFKSFVICWELSHCSWDTVLLALALEHASLACPFFLHAPHDRWMGCVQFGSIWPALPQRKHFSKSLSLLICSSLKG